MNSMQHQVLIIGGGVVGLSLAYDLACHGVQSQLIDRGELGREASWAGAGILPPANVDTALHPYEKLCGMSYNLHARWADRLRAETGIDNGFRRCGGLYLARTQGEAASLRGLANECAERRLECQRWPSEEIVAREPALSAAVAAGRFKAAFYLPDECQIRNPHHLKALVAACRARGVELAPNVEATEFVVRGQRLEGVKTSAGVLRAEQYCLTGGAWTQQLLAKLGIANGILPIRGQMLLYRCESKPFTAVLNEGNRYLVARDDGHVLVGSTEEEVGFDKRTTPEALADLQQFATELLPVLKDATLERSWAGLRPASFDGFPYLGRIPTLSNAFVAAGHFRSGLYLSPGTAVLMRQAIMGEESIVPLEPFRLGRG
jgi:glycine oxidase